MRELTPTSRIFLILLKVFSIIRQHGKQRENLYSLSEPDVVHQKYGLGGLCSLQHLEDPYQLVPLQCESFCCHGACLQFSQLVVKARFMLRMNLLPEVGDALFFQPHTPV